VKEVTRKLSSLSFASWTVAALILWCALGIVLAGSKALSDQVFHMNEMILRDWLIRPQQGALLLKVWFLGLCAGMMVLGVNLVFCTWNKFVRLITRNRSGVSKYVMLVVHILFGLVALGHLGSFMLGYRYENIRLSEGEAFDFGSGLSIRLERVHFVDDLRVLQLTHRGQTAADFHYRSNYADMVLSRGGREVYRDRVFILDPMRFKAIQVTLKRFTSPRLRRSEKPGVVLVVSRNPVLTTFLLIYPFMIVGIGLFLGITWRKPHGSMINPKPAGLNQIHHIHPRA